MDLFTPQQDNPSYLPRLGLNRLRQGFATEAGEEGALVGVSIIHEQVIIRALCVHEGEI